MAKPHHEDGLFNTFFVPLFRLLFFRRHQRAQMQLTLREGQDSKPASALTTTASEERQRTVPPTTLLWIRGTKFLGCTLKDHGPNLCRFRGKQTWMLRGLVTADLEVKRSPLALSIHLSFVVYIHPVSPSFISSFSHPLPHTRSPRTFQLNPLPENDVR